MSTRLNIGHGTNQTFMFCYEIIAIWIQYCIITFRENDVTEYCVPRPYVSTHKIKTGIFITVYNVMLFQRSLLRGNGMVCFATTIPNYIT